MISGFHNGLCLRNNMHSTTVRRSIPKFTIYRHNELNEEIARGSIIIHNERANGAVIGMIEDIWTHENYRKQGIASSLVNDLIEKAKKYNCYKVILDCEDHNVHLYETLGFKKWQNSMRKDL